MKDKIKQLRETIESIDFLELVKSAVPCYKQGDEVTIPLTTIGKQILNLKFYEDKEGRKNIKLFTQYFINF